MLVQFSVSNYRSIGEEITLSMVGANLVSQDKGVDENNVFSAGDDLRLLKSAVIYGANASGKSNIVRAIRFMSETVLDSSRESQAEDPIKVEPFRFSRELAEQPSSFECIFLLGGVEYRYGFEVTREEVVGEWLFHRPAAREVRLFLREHQSIKSSREFKEGKGLESRTRKNALFLSVVAQFNGPIASAVLAWFSNLNVISGLNDNEYREYTTQTFANGLYREQIKELLGALDLGIDDFLVEESSFNEDSIPAELPPELREVFIRYGSAPNVVRTVHRRFDPETGREVSQIFDLDEHESEGTRKMFALAGPLVDTLTHGDVLVIDEFDARIHPLVCRELLKIFNSNKQNPDGAQLIICTHDTNLLSNKLLRRDQIWFAEKDPQSATKLVSLAEYKVRNDASYESDYIRGKYGAIPFLGDLSRLFGDAQADT